MADGKRESGVEVIATYAGTEVIRAKHHAVVVETNTVIKSTDFLTHRLGGENIRAINNN